MDADQRVDAALHRFLRAHSIDILRVVLGVVILAFGVLKFFPGVSPAEELSKMTTDKLSFGLAPSHVAIVIVAALETTIGLLLITGRFLRLAVYLLFGQLIGILAPLALFTDRLFAGPHNAPTIEGQYVVKDLIIVAAGFVVASTLPGIVPGSEPAPSARQGSRARSGGARTDWTDWSAVHG
jgi:putative oxidoreductase